MNSLEMNSLRSIGQRLGLGYSTILHKFRQFRATHKVKGGVLISSTQTKRKYKKSRQIEDLIAQALTERSFFTAVELSKYIFNKYGKSLSRSIISRHLGEMGYSYRSNKSISKQPNSNQSKDVNSNTIKEIRKDYAFAIVHWIYRSNA